VLRRLFAIFFTFTSLSAGASAAFACAMMGEVVMPCCCGGDETMSMQSHGDQPCCQPITLVGGDEATSPSAAVASKPAQPDFPPQPLAAPSAELVLLREPLRHVALLATPAPLSRSGSLTYLHTQRLRI